jgi:hypothetical protein
MMQKRTSTLIALMALTCTIAMTAAAQEQPPAAKPGEQPARAPVQANIRLELTITDQRSDAQAAPKTVTLVVEDRQNGRIRTGRGPAVLNLDVHPEIVREGRIRLFASLEFTSQDSPERPAQPAIQESIVALVDDGKALVLSQSADPTSDRKVRLEVKATILR